MLYSFAGSDGSHPRAGLIADAAGNLYGTTEGGDGPGAVFQLTPSGTLNVLHNFTGRDGAVPHGGLIADAAGNLYGTTHNGGASGYGTVFQLTPSGALNVLYSFTGVSDGAYPEAGVIADMAGNLYGTTYGGGAAGQGTVFQLTPSRALNVLHSFTGGSDGGRPAADLIADAAGNLYGTSAIFLSGGQMEVVIGDGATRRFGPGDAVLFEDLTGQGHTSRSVGGDRLTAIVPLAD